MRSPIVWFGGKGHLAKKLVPLLESIPHRRYIEVFGGGASVLLAKRPVGVEVYNDLDGGLYNFFTVLSEPEMFERFYRLVALLPYSRRLYDESLSTWKQERDRVKSAAKWFVVARQSFGGRFGASWGSDVTTVRSGKVETAQRWLAALDRLPEVHARLQRVQIECVDWRVILSRYDTPETLFYLDPPYVADTRRDGTYAHEMSLSDHAALVEVLLNIRGSAVLSGYAHAVYRPLEDAGWERRDWKTVCHAAGRTRATGILGAGAAKRMQPRTESVWIKPYQSQLRLF